jgi:hypothetical protein
MHVCDCIVPGNADVEESHTSTMESMRFGDVMCRLNSGPSMKNESFDTRAFEVNTVNHPLPAAPRVY